MAQHEPEGSLLAIHSVCVAAAMQRRRVATRLLRAYLQFVLATTPQLQEVRGGGAGRAGCCWVQEQLEAARWGLGGSGGEAVPLFDTLSASCVLLTLPPLPPTTQVRLICKEPLIPLYAGAGFQMVGPSDVVSGWEGLEACGWRVPASRGADVCQEGC